MKWHHEVDPRWVEARKKYLTATDVVGLLPELKRMSKKPGEISPGCVALWAEKQADREPDVASFNAAARGHIFEPYAVDDFNGNYQLNMYHWDDCLIYKRGEDKSIALAFSPDALNIEPIYGHVELSAEHELPNIQYSMLEVKSYDPAHHMNAMLTDKMELKERYQIAVGMCVLDQMQQGFLMLYCPAVRDYSIQVFHYKRDELTEEIATVLRVYDMYNNSIEQFVSKQEKYSSSYTEEDIWNELIEDELDPFIIRRR